MDGGDSKRIYERTEAVPNRAETEWLHWTKKKTGKEANFFFVEEKGGWVGYVCRGGKVGDERSQFEKWGGVVVDVIQGGLHEGGGGGKEGKCSVEV